MWESSVIILSPFRSNDSCFMCSCVSWAVSGNHKSHNCLNTCLYIIILVHLHRFSLPHSLYSRTVHSTVPGSRDTSAEAIDTCTHRLCGFLRWAECEHWRKGHISPHCSYLSRRRKCQWAHSSSWRIFRGVERKDLGISSQRTSVASCSLCCS
jgi:hypothetical protein